MPMFQNTKGTPPGQHWLLGVGYGFFFGKFAVLFHYLRRLGFFLDSHDAVIVDGPRPGGPGGMYRVRVARRYVDKEELDRLVREFQSASILISMAVPTEYRPRRKRISVDDIRLSGGAWRPFSVRGAVPPRGCSNCDPLRLRPHRA
jgi:hypothetical protein